MQRSNVLSGSPMENLIGFSRAVRVGNIIFVSGTAAILPDGTTAYPGDLYKQAKYCIKIVKNAIKEAGGQIEDVIRTRVMLKDISRWEEAAMAHKECFGAVKPACTFFEVKSFIKEEWLVEIEADCVIKSGKFALKNK